MEGRSERALGAVPNSGTTILTRQKRQCGGNGRSSIWVIYSHKPYIEILSDEPGSSTRKTELVPDENWKDGQVSVLTDRSRNSSLLGHSASGVSVLPIKNHETISDRLPRRCGPKHIYRDDEFKSIMYVEKNGSLCTFWAFDISFLFIFLLYLIVMF